MTSKSSIFKLLDSHFESDLIQDYYLVEEKNSKDLITTSRIDIAFKLLYLEYANFDFAKEIYKDHIRAFSLGSFKEPGDTKKSDIDDYIVQFNEILNSIKAKNFVETKSIIPISRNGSIANGAHRLSSCIYLNKKVFTVNIGCNDHIYDYKFFFNRNTPITYLDIAALKFIEYANNIHLAFIWPTASGYDDEVEKIIPNILYRKDISLTLNGAHNLLSQIYYAEEWLGDIENNFKGVQNKLIECFKNLNPVRTIAFQCESLEEVLKIKKKIRGLFKYGKHSIHITDTKDEILRVSRLIFNDNSLHFLNNSYPNKYISTSKKINQFKLFLSKNNINFKDVVLDSGIVLSAYGIRECNDIDYFTRDNSKIKYQIRGIDLHDDQLKYHDEEKLEMIYNPKNYFYYENLKFLSFNRVYKMKIKRRESKDLNDTKLMEALVENKKFKKYFTEIKQKLLYTKVKIKQKIIKALKFIGVFNSLKKLIKN